MKKTFITSVLVFVFINMMLSSQASAYSYGDPSEEKIAEAYKEIMIKLDEDPPNYSESKKIYETVREEVDQHMGEEPSKVILENLENKEKEQAIENLDELLVLNIARRLEGIDKNFSEYDTSKRLLAKGFATYKTLSPKVEGKNPELDQKIRTEFDQALESLGNPGLFGVGTKESDQDAFKQSKTFIMDSLQKEFNIKSLEVGHFAESATEEASQKQEWTDISNLKNWVPIVVIVVVLAAAIVYAVRKRR
ncbi:hypothetical protein CN378_22005 [Bacillus sp. AFS015802]|uniref:hypothetical protein n=1 Tax=Bacillus sp. AFS015802 TaxID=2033486 RepID=UPI000BFA1415|nr:hypothetical protein [Bacillus sp. AFS015802]PFA61861.1 hypothetical protein CN378_22005 [Bacillus sp. AFS015802]